LIHLTEENLKQKRKTNAPLRRRNACVWKTKQASRKTENDERSYEQVKSIKMVGQGQLSAKKCTLE